MCYVTIVFFHVVSSSKVVVLKIRWRENLRMKEQRAPRNTTAAKTKIFRM